MLEHSRISALTGKRVKGDDDSSIKEHLLLITHPILKISQFFFTNNNDFQDMLMESFLINRDHPALNKNKQSLPLELFDN